MTPVVIALGSNLGDRRYNLRRAVDELRRVIRLVRISSIHDTDPVDAPIGSPRFLNMVVTGLASQSPQELLQELQAIEARLGRVRRGRNAPRTIDVDLIFHGATRMRTRHLTLPHPRFHLREFVLAPLREIWPGGTLKRFAAILVLLFLALGASAQTTYVKSTRLFDGQSVRSDVAVVVSGGKITGIVAATAVPRDARVIDVGTRLLMPGLIDAHTHLALHPGDYEGQIMRETPEFRAIWATVNARKTLEAGITTVRDLGNEGAGFADIALRDAIAKGLVEGPRILPAIQPVTATGAYQINGFSPYATLPAIASNADGVAEVRREVPRLVQKGADVIKMYMESYEKRQPRHDMLSGAMNYSPEEVNALVEEAHRAGVRVAAHTYSDEAARIAVDAGVNSIDHGLYLSEETFRRMAAKDIYYVPTLIVYEFWRDAKIFGPISPENKAKLTKTVEEHTAAFKRALKTPVKIAFGSDTFELPGTNAQEIVAMVRYGMKPIDALRAATSTSAALLGVSDVTGSIEVGKSADLVAFDGDPLTDISSIEKPFLVMKEGRVIGQRVPE